MNDRDHGIQMTLSYPVTMQKKLIKTIKSLKLKVIKFLKLRHIEKFVFFIQKNNYDYV